MLFFMKNFSEDLNLKISVWRDSTVMPAQLADINTKTTCSFIFFRIRTTFFLLSDFCSSKVDWDNKSVFLALLQPTDCFSLNMTKKYVYLSIKCFVGTEHTSDGEKWPQNGYKHDFFVGLLWKQTGVLHYFCSVYSLSGFNMVQLHTHDVLQ